MEDRALVSWRILLILLFFNMLDCAYSRPCRLDAVLGNRVQ